LGATGVTDFAEEDDKHRRTLSLGALEALAIEAAAVGRARGKLGIVVIKRRAAGGRPPGWS